MHVQSLSVVTLVHDELCLNRAVEYLLVCILRLLLTKQFGWVWILDEILQLTLSFDGLSSHPPPT